MSTEQLLIQRLESLKVRYALEALQASSHRDVFEYGERTGVIKGITMSIEVIEELVAELKRTDD